MIEESQTFLQLLELEKVLENESRVFPNKLSEYTTKKRVSSPSFVSSLTSFGIECTQKFIEGASDLQEKIGMIANAKEFIKNNYISLIILIVSIFLTSCSSLLFFVFSNLKTIISTFTLILKTVTGFDFGTAIKAIIYDQLVTIIIRKMTQECCINSPNSTSSYDMKKLVSSLRNISRHTGKVNSGSVDTTCRAIFALTKPFSTVMSTMKSSYTYIYTTFISIFTKLMIYFSIKKVTNETIIDPNSGESQSIDVNETISQTVPLELTDTQQFYPEIHVRRQLYIKSCSGNDDLFSKKIVKNAVYTLAALYILIVFVPGMSKVLSVAKFISKTFVVSNLVSLLQNKKILAYIAGLQVFVALYLCCIYKRQPTVVNTKLITRKFVKNRILRCSTSSSKTGLMESMAPLINLKSLLLTKSMVYATKLFSGVQKVREEFNKGNILVYIGSYIQIIVKLILKACDGKTIAIVFDLIKKLVTVKPENMASVQTMLTKKATELIQQVLSYFSGSKVQPPDDESGDTKKNCRESLMYKNSILGCALFSYYETYKKNSLPPEEVTFDKNRQLSFESAKLTLEEVRKSFTLYDDDTKTKVTDTVGPDELLLYTEVEDELLKYSQEVVDIDNFCSYLQLTILTQDKLEEGLRMKVKSLDDFIDTVLKKQSFEFFGEIKIDNSFLGQENRPRETFYVLGEKLQSSLEKASQTGNVLVGQMYKLLYDEDVSASSSDEGNNYGTLLRRRLWSCEAYENVVSKIINIFKTTDDTHFENDKGVTKSYTLEKVHKVTFATDEMYYVELKYYYKLTDSSVTFSCDFSKIFLSSTNVVAEIVISGITPILKVSLYTKKPSGYAIFSSSSEPQIITDSNDIAFVIDNYQKSGFTLNELSFSKLKKEFKDHLQNSFFITVDNIKNPPTPPTPSTPESSTEIEPSWLLYFDSSKVVNYFVLDTDTRFGIYHNESFFSGTTSRLFFLSEDICKKFIDNLENEERVGSTNYHKFQELMGSVNVFPNHSGSGRQSRKRIYSSKSQITKKRSKFV